MRSQLGRGGKALTNERVCRELLLAGRSWHTSGKSTPDPPNNSRFGLRSRRRRRLRCLRSSRARGGEVWCGRWPALVSAILFPSLTRCPLLSPPAVGVPAWPLSSESRELNSEPRATLGLGGAVRAAAVLGLGRRSTANATKPSRGEGESKCCDCCVATATSKRVA